MKVWMIIYMFGQIGGSVGPLPYDMAECESRIAEMTQQGRAEYERRKDDPDFIAKTNGAIPGLSLVFKCETWDKRPDNTYVDK